MFNGEIGIWVISCNCLHAHYFIGTYDSTSTLHIHWMKSTIVARKKRWIKIAMAIGNKQFVLRISTGRRKPSNFIVILQIVVSERFKRIWNCFSCISEGKTMNELWLHVFSLYCCCMWFSLFIHRERDRDRDTKNDEFQALKITHFNRKRLACCTCTAKQCECCGD